MKEIYRFRNAESLIRRFKELQNQEIYFASPEELNDPMEGYRDIYWKGDEIIWKNFILNYIKSFEQIFKLYSVVIESKKIDESDIIDTFKLAGGFTSFNTQIIDKVSEKFFKIPFIQKLPEALSKRINPIRRSELISYLQFIHPLLINSVSQTYYENGLISFPLLSKDLTEFEKVIEASGSLPDLLNKIELENKNKSLESFLTVIGIYSQSNLLLARKSYDKKLDNENSLFLFYEFPNKYLDKLTRDIYPLWYSASFLSDCKNSAIWGHYGDNHKGICLIFKTTLDDKNEMQLNLETEYGYNSGPIVGMRPHKFRKIKYENIPTEIDFFRSIGRLRKFELNKLWYSDTNGNKSICGQHLIDSEEEWREKYWNNFFDSFSIKLKEWEYENEYRLVIHGDFVDYTEKSSRKLKYDFKDLSGIIFGIRTSITDKIDIMKIIEQKCAETNRTDFDFLQAYYSNETKQIETFKMPNSK